MTAPALFEHPDFGSVRVIEMGGNPWFVAADICRVLRLTNPSMAVASLDADERTTLRIAEGGPEANIISEPGLYALLARSRRPEAKAFDRWVRHEVLPAIRATGTYTAPSAEQLPQAPGAGSSLALRALQQTMVVLVEQERQITALHHAQQDQGRELAEQRTALAVVEQRVAAATGRPGWCTVLSFAKTAHLKARDRGTLAMIGRRAAAVCRAQGIEPEPVPDARWGLVNTYPEWALAKVVDELVGEGVL